MDIKGPVVSIGTRRGLLVAAVLFTALALRLFYFVGISINDDIAYADSAHKIATGKELAHYPLGSIDSIRFLMVLPVAVSYRLFGIGELSSSLYPLLCSILTIYLAYAVAGAIFGWRAGIGAAVVLACIPLDIVYSTQLVPTVPLASAVLGSFLAFAKGEAYGNGERSAAGKKGRWYFFLSGILLGIGWLINEPALLFVPAILLYPAFRSGFRRIHILFAVGLLMVMLSESIFFKVTTGDPLWRFKVVHAEETRVQTNTAMDYYPRTLFKARGVNCANQEGYFGIFWYACVAASLYVLAFRRRAGYFLVLGLLFVMYYLQYGIMTLGGRPIAKWIRYMEMVLPFAAILTSYAVLDLGRMGPVKWKGRFLLVLLLLSGIFFIPGAVEAERAQTLPMKHIAEYLGKTPSDIPVYLDSYAHGFVGVYLGRRRDLRFLDDPHLVLSAIRGAYIVLNASRGALESKEPRHAKIPREEAAVPPSWRLVQRIDTPWNTVYGSYRPLIYYVPPYMSRMQPYGSTVHQTRDLILKSPSPLPAAGRLTLSPLGRGWGEGKLRSFGQQ